MNRAGKTIGGIGLAVLLGACFAACSSAEDPDGDGGGGNTPATGGASGSPGTGGKAGSGTGGGSAGTTQATGGASGTTGNAGTAGLPGTGGNATGGASGGPGAGTGGDTGGSSPTTGGSAGTGGSDVGGSAGNAGAGGGDPVVELPPLVTSAMGAYWKTDGALTDSTATPTVTVNTTEAQTWDGFGGAFNELGWKFLTSADMQTKAMMLLFSAAEGANFAWGRIPMGASDYAESRYTLADTGGDPAPSGETNRPPADTALAMFSLARDETKLIPYIKAAQGVKPNLRFWASPWTPPVWMKTGFKANSGADSSMNAKKPSFYDGGNFNGTDANLAAYAQYYVKFVNGYKEKGINIEIVSPQNEPGYDQNYPSCLWDNASYAKFIGQHLGPAMMPLGIKVMLGTLSNDMKDFAIASAALADSAAKPFLTVIGAQWNTLDAGKLNNLNSGLPVWASEHKCGNYPWNPQGSPAYNSTQAPNDHPYAIESWGYIRDAIKTVKVTSYNAWNMVLDKSGLGNDTTRDWKQNALLVADGGQVNTTPTYHVFRHMSQYVRPGAKVLGTTGGDAVAFKNPDGSIVAVMFNSGAANANYVVSLGGKTVQFAMPQSGWATVMVKP